MGQDTQHTAPTGPATAAMVELDRESAMGGLGAETARREIRRIDLTGFEERRAEITGQLWEAATDIGFFQITGHGITPQETDAAFEAAAAFFALPAGTKQRYAMAPGTNAGWEHRSQVRPSVGIPDEKESYQLTQPRMAGLWPADEEVAGFRDTVLAFESHCREVAMRVLSCFADRLGMEREFFARAHDPLSAGHQSTLRLLHYFEAPKAPEGSGVWWRAGAHTDFDCLTLLFQREGQGGLQVCPGAERDAQEWTPVPATADAITCNIGDMLMRWSDDRLPSNFHRVKAPGPGDDHGARQSIAYFAQADRDVLIESPQGLYPPITAGDYIKQRIAANFAGAPRD